MYQLGKNHWSAVETGMVNVDMIVKARYIRLSNEIVAKLLFCCTKKSVSNRLDNRVSTRAFYDWVATGEHEPYSIFMFSCKCIRCQFFTVLVMY